MPPVLWEIGGESTPSADIIERCAAAGAAWFLISSDVPNERVTQFATLLGKDGVGGIVFGMRAASFALRSTKHLDDRLAALGRRCDAVLLQDVSLAEVKEGRTFHRAAQLREQGRVELCLVDSTTTADAEWMVLHTPAHGVALAYGLADQTARYRILPEAAEVATAIFARRPEKPVWPVDAERASRAEDISFALAHPAVTAVIEPLPTSVADLETILRAAQHPMPAAQADERWQAFTQVVPEPQKLRGGHPPEWA
jgi:hypothetical protein